MVGVENWNILAGVIWKTTSLEKLVFNGGNTVAALQNDRVVSALVNNCTIKELTLREAGCGNEGAKAVASILKENSTIEVVDLSENYIIGVEGAKVIAEALKQNASLQKLYLSSNSIGAEGAKAIAEALKENRSLQKLNLQCINIGDQGAKAIAEALKENPSLRELYIGWNNIGDQGAKAIAEALKENSSLQGLCIQSNRIGEKGGKDIINALQQIERSAIENIYFRNTVSDGTQTKIKQEIIRIQNRFKSVGSNEGQATEDGYIQCRKRQRSA